MATSTTTAWAKGFSDNPKGRILRSRSIIVLLDRIGSEKVRAPGVSADDPDALLITRRELLARVLWTRAILDADNASTKLIIEYLDGKPGEAEAAPGRPPALTADDMALAEAMLQESLGNASHRDTETTEGERGRRGDGEEVSDDDADVP
jgi:hypothetical protein